MRAAINQEELKRLVTDNPGINIAAIKDRFDCSSIKVMRGLRPLRDDFLFRQVDKGNVYYYEAGYAKKHHIKQSILATPKGTKWYSDQKKKKVKRVKQVKSFVELQRLLNVLWPVMRSSQ